jgi:hypothetical protein
MDSRDGFMRLLVYSIFNGNGTGHKNTTERFGFLGIHYIHYGEDAFQLPISSRNKVKLVCQLDCSFLHGI